MGMKNGKSGLWIVWVPAVVMTLVLGGIVHRTTGLIRDSLIVAMIGSVITTVVGLAPLLVMGRPWIRGFGRAVRAGTTARLTMVVVVSIILGRSMNLSWRWFLGWMGLIHLMIVTVETVLLVWFLNRCDWTVRSSLKPDEYLVSTGEEFGS
jgi:hypothetical protein